LADAVGFRLITTSSPVPSPPGLPSPIVTPSPDATPSPSATPTPVVTPTPAASPSPAASPVPSVSPTPAVTPTPTVAANTTSNGGGGGGGGTGPVSNTAQPPVCSATSPSGTPNVTIVSTGTNTVTLSWTAVSPVTHYGLYFRRNSDGAEYGATNIGNVTTYTITNLSGQDSYTFQVFGVNDCAPGPRGQAGSSQISGPILTGRPVGAGGQVLGVSTSASPTPTPSATPGSSPTPEASPSVLGATDEACSDYRWWWVPMVIFAIVAVVMAFTLNNNNTPRRIVTIVGFGLTAIFLYYWKCQPIPWIIGTGIGGAIVELFTTFLLSDDEEEHAPKTQTTHS